MCEKKLNEEQVKSILDFYKCVCWACDGTGTKAISLNAYDVEDVPCPACGGSGVFVVD